jgi:hypothetical protein
MKSVAIGAHLLRDDVEPLAVAVPVGDLFVSAVEVADDQPIGDRDLLLRVAAIRAKLLDAATFIALRYGFTFASADDARGKCASHLDRWKRLLTQHREEVEMTLKIAASSSLARPDRHAFTSGADYLRALHAAKESAQVDPAFRAAARETLVPLATKYRWMNRDEKSIELAMLVRRDDLDRVRDAGEKLRAAASETPFLLSGPWPLEVFADDDHE